MESRGRDFVCSFPRRSRATAANRTSTCPDYLLRRHDYRVEASGGFAAAQYVYEPRTVQGITFPTRRRAYMRDEENRAMREKVMVSIDISEVAFL